MVLIVLIVIAWSTDPRRDKGGAMRPPPNPLLEQFAASPGEDQPQQPAQPRQNQQAQPANQRQQTSARPPSYDAAAFSDFELLTDRYGRSDPFAPFYEIPQPEERLLDMPPIEPLPPMILESPPNMHLSAVSIQQNGVGMAVINGDIVRIGDYVMGFRVHYISKSRVELINELGDKAILRIQQAIPRGYDVSSGEISNIQEEPEEEPRRNAVQRRQQSPLPLPPSNWTDLRPDQLPAAPPARQRTQPAEPDISITPDPQQDALDEIQKILSNPENRPAE